MTVASTLATTIAYLYTPFILANVRDSDDLFAGGTVLEQRFGLEFFRIGKFDPGNVDAEIGLFDFDDLIDSARRNRQKERGGGNGTERETGEWLHMCLLKTKELFPFSHGRWRRYLGIGDKVGGNGLDMVESGDVFCRFEVVLKRRVFETFT